MVAHIWVIYQGRGWRSTLSWWCEQGLVCRSVRNYRSSNERTVRHVSAPSEDSSERLRVQGSVLWSNLCAVEKKGFSVDSRHRPRTLTKGVRDCGKSPPEASPKRACPSCFGTIPAPCGEWTWDCPPQCRKKLFPCCWVCLRASCFFFFFFTCYFFFVTLFFS